MNPRLADAANFMAFQEVMCAVLWECEVSANNDNCCDSWRNSKPILGSYGTVLFVTPNGILKHIADGFYFVTNFLIIDHNNRTKSEVSTAKFYSTYTNV